MRITRRFTDSGKSPYENIPFRRTTSEIRNPDGTSVFKAEKVEVPAAWSQVACDVLAQKYFRKRGIPSKLVRVPEEGIPSWLWRSVSARSAQQNESDDQDIVVLSNLASAIKSTDLYGDDREEEDLDDSLMDERSAVEDTAASEEETCGETSAKQVFDRLAGTWTYWGWKGGYFDSEDDAEAFYDELRYMLAMQQAAPNSPQWFNTGLHWAYGIDGPSQGHHYVDFRTGKLVRSESAYEHPQPHACFIQSVDDDLVNDNGIMDLWVREARLFKYGSGTGTNFSRLRGEGESLSGGGKSSGLMSFLKIGDRAAGAIKSGGTTRRAAKMVSVDLDHPDIEDYINWKVTEEQKVAALVTGSRLCSQHLNAGHGRLPPGQARPRRRERSGSQAQLPLAGGTQGCAPGRDFRKLSPAGAPVCAPGL